MVIEWLQANWIDLLQVFGLLFAAIEIRNNTKARRLSNLFSVTNAHDNLWRDFGDSKTQQILEASRNLTIRPLSQVEKEHLNRQIHHVKLGYEALKDGIPVSRHGVNKDIGEFFSLPAVASFWNEAKLYHDSNFVSFIDRNIAAARVINARDTSCPR